MKAFPISQNLDEIQAEVDLNTAKVTDLVHPLVETAVPAGALFTDTVYDDTDIQAEVDLNTAKVTDLVHPLVQTAVPAGALFTDTDTVYDDTDIQAEVDLNTAKVTDLAHPLVETAVPAGALFTDTVFDDTDIQAEVDLNTAKETNIAHPLVETAVPAGALFTDTNTVYDDTAIQNEVDLNTAKETNIAHPLVETAVPAGALFTDTVYDDTDIQNEVDLNTAKVSDLVHPLVETAVPAGALFTDTVYDDTAIQNEVDLNTAKVSDLTHPLVETAVPAGALFTDTVYDDTDIQNEVNLNTAKVTNIAHPLVETAVPAGALFTDTVYDDTDIQNEVDLNTIAKHLHLNKIVLDKFGENGSGLPTYNGNSVDTTIAQRDVYSGLDSNNNSISLSASQGKVLKDVQDIQQIDIDLNTAKVTDLAHPLVETAVPAGALFTDTNTVYDDTDIQAEVDLNTAKVSDLVHPLVETAVPASALFTDTIYNDIDIQAEVDLNTAKVTDLAHPLVEIAVPAGALFTDTDTVYDDTAIQAEVDLNTDNIKLKEGLTTGYIDGLRLSVNLGDPTKFDIEAGKYVITDYTDPLNPIPTVLNFDGLSGITSEFLAVSSQTYIAIDVDKLITQRSSKFTFEDRREYCTIGDLNHSNNTIINSVSQIKAPILGGANQLHDFMKIVGALNVDGNVFSPNGANLSLNKTAGSIFNLGINTSNFANPHVLPTPELNNLTFRYRLQNGDEGLDVTEIDPTKYDLNGVLTTVPDNHFTLQHISLFNSNKVVIQRGQKLYTTILMAKAFAGTDPFNKEIDINEHAIFRAYLVIKKNVTDLELALTNNTAHFIIVNKFGGIVAGSSSDITYDTLIETLGYVPSELGHTHNISEVNSLQDVLDNKVEKIEDHELVSTASLIHRTRMSIRQDNMNMKLILR
jgi:hypothetical protein